MAGNGTWPALIQGHVRSMRRATGLAIGIILAVASACAHASDAGKRLAGTAAFYDANYKGTTASGERYDPNKFTAAHKTLPFGTHLHVTDARTGRSVDVVVNDRGPFNKGRMLDLSLAAAKSLRMTGRGLIKVTATVQPAGLQPASYATAAKP
jgi:rare lipoprotein A